MSSLSAQRAHIYYRVRVPKNQTVAIRGEPFLQGMDMLLALSPGVALVAMGNRAPERRARGHIRLFLSTAVLHLRHNVAWGMAFSRAGSILSPQFSQMP